MYVIKHTENSNKSFESVFLFLYLFNWFNGVLAWHVSWRVVALPVVLAVLGHVDVEVDGGVDGGGQVADVGQVVHPQGPGQGIVRLKWIVEEIKRWLSTYWW